MGAVRIRQLVPVLVTTLKCEFGLASSRMVFPTRAVAAQPVVVFVTFVTPAIETKITAAKHSADQQVENLAFLIVKRASASRKVSTAVGKLAVAMPKTLSCGQIVVNHSTSHQAGSINLTCSSITIYFIKRSFKVTNWDRTSY